MRRGTPRVERSVAPAGMEASWSWLLCAVAGLLPALAREETIGPTHQFARGTLEVELLRIVRLGSLGLASAEREDAAVRRWCFFERWLGGRSRVAKCR